MLKVKVRASSGRVRNMPAADAAQISNYSLGGRTWISAACLSKMAW